MQLSINFDGTHESEEIQLSDLYKLAHVIDLDTFQQALMIHVAGLAIEHNVGFDEVQPSHVEGDSSDELTIKSQVGMTWVEEVSKLYWHVVVHGDDPDRYLAYIDDVGWNFFDFDDFERVDDNFHSEFDGDYEEFSREWLESRGEMPDEHLEGYFDFEEHGKDVIEGDYTVLDWGYNQYLFSR